MTPETEAAHREAEDRIATMREALRRPAAAQRDEDLDTRIAAIMACIPIMSPEEQEIAERRRAEAEERRAKVEHAQRRASTMEALADLPIAREMIEAIVDGSLGDSQSVRAVRAWFDAKAKPVLVLLGGIGTGKTVAGAWLMAQHAMSGRRGVASYVKMRALANLYRAGFGDDAKEFAEILRAPLLVVDELTTERDADLGRAALHEVIDERASRRRPTLLLANRTKDEIAKHYDARTIDRLRESAVVVTLAAKSMRKGAAW